MVRIGVLVLCTAAVMACSNPTTPTSPSNVARLDVGSSVGATEDFGPSSTTASSAAPSPAAANFEQKFMMGMIDHHQMAVEMAQVCLSKAVHEELRQLCEGIVATQTREIQQMQAWLQDWYAISYSPQTTRSGERDLTRLSSASGAEFEIMFMEMMIQHHEAAIKEARTCIDRAYHRPLIRLCENILAAQSAEIDQMKQWLCAWYSRCATAS